MSPRGTVPPTPRGQAAGTARAGSPWGGVPAGARTRGCGPRRGARAANPLLAPPAPPARAGPGRRVRGGGGESGRGRARSSPAAGTAGGPGRPCWYSGHSRSPDLPAEQGRPGARHGRCPRAVSPGCGAVGALLPPNPSPPLQVPRTPSPALIRRRRGGQGNALSGTGANSETKDIK